MNDNQYEVSRLGVVRNVAKRVEDVPSEGLPSQVVMDDCYAPALLGIEPGDFIYVIVLFHLADQHTMQGSPNSHHAQGAFSIRSSCRPNRIGMTLSRVTAVKGPSLSFEWLDFCDGTPVIDLKRYNWRWEGAFSARRLDRRFIERQIDRNALVDVYERPITNFIGVRDADTRLIAELAASLSQDYDIRMTDPSFTVEVRGNGIVCDAVQAITGATIGGGRFSFLFDSSRATVALENSGIRVCAVRDGTAWKIAVEKKG